MSAMALLRFIVLMEEEKLEEDGWTNEWVWNLGGEVFEKVAGDGFLRGGWVAWFLMSGKVLDWIVVGW